MQRDVARERAELDREVDGRTVCDVFADTAARLAGRDALVSSGTVRSWTAYREEVRAVAMGLAALGFAPGDFAVILSRNRAEHYIADLGVVHARGTPVSLYTTLAPEQIEYIAGHCDARVAFVESAAFLARLDAARPRLPKLEHVVLLDGSAPGTILWADLLARGREAHARDVHAFDAMWRAVTPDDAITLIYTSGTTGNPKGVIDTHRSVLWDVTSLRRQMPSTEDDHAVSYLPTAHAADRIVLHYSSLVGGQVTHFCPEVTQILPTLLEVRPTLFGAVPRVWEKLAAGIQAGIAREPDEAKRGMLTGAIELARQVVRLEQRGEPVPDELRAKRRAIEPVFAAIRAKIGLDRTRRSVTGAAPTPVDVLELFHAIGLPISEVWGMSELAAIGTVNPFDRIKLGSIGVTLPGVEAKIAGDGELLVRGGMVMRGYYKDPAQTAATIDRDGWLATGDVARVDDDGYYYIVDRKKELIITAGGKNISPANLENLLKAHPLIGQACVIGDNRPYLVALLVLDAPNVAAFKGDVEAEIERAVAQVNEHVSRVENIRRYKILPGEWTAESEELTPTLKLKRRVIATKYARLIDELYQ